MFEANEFSLLEEMNIVTDVERCVQGKNFVLVYEWVYEIWRLDEGG